MIASLAAIISIWLCLDANFSTHLLMNNDALLQLPSLTHVLQNGGPSNVFYRPDILGGTPVADILGRIPIYDFAAKLNIPVVLAMNIALIFVQILLGFLGAKATTSLALLWGQTNQIRLPLFASLASTFAFLPVIGARVQYGHLDLIYGMLLFSVIFSALICWRSKQVTFTYLFLLFLALWHCIPSQGHQIKLYSVVFGLPIFISFILTFSQSELVHWLRENKKYSLSIFVFIVGCCVFSLTRFIDLFKYATSTDALRSLGSESVLYSYPGTEIYNYFASLTFNYKILADTLDPLRISESYFSVGSFILILILLRGRQLFLFAGLLVSLLLSMALALNISPISEALTLLMPPLKNFRVPERSLVPFCLALPMISLALILSRFEIRTQKYSYFILPVCLLLSFILSDTNLEIYYWAFSVTSLVLYFKKSKYCPSVFVMSVVLMVASIQGFESWRQPSRDRTADIQSAIQAGNEIKNRSRELTSPLYRTYFEAFHREFNVTTSTLFDVSTLSGYWNPTRRFLELLSALEGRDYHITSTYFNILPNAPGRQALQGLYNVRYNLVSNQNKNVELKNIDSTAGPAWASSSIFFVDGTKELGRYLNSQSSNFSNFLRATWVLNSQDPIVQEQLSTLKSKDLSRCNSGIVTEPVTSQDGQTFTFETQFESECPVTLALNYYQRFTATSVDEKSSSKSLLIVPAYGSLLATVVPAGRNKITISAQRSESVIHWITCLIGTLCLGVGIILFYQFTTVVIEMPKKQKGSKYHSNK